VVKGMWVNMCRLGIETEKLSMGSSRILLEVQLFVKEEKGM